MTRTFQFAGHSFDLIQQEAGTHIGERTVEVPLLQFVLKTWRYDERPVLEIGAVSPYWQGRNPDKVTPDYPVIDPYDPWPGCVKVDAEQVDYTGKYVVSVSTLEHMGYTEYGNPDLDLLKAPTVLNKILRQAAGYFLTWPIGYNLSLDQVLQHMPTLPGCRMLRQITGDNLTWAEAPLDFSATYNSVHPYANGLVVLTKGTVFDGS